MSRLRIQSREYKVMLRTQKFTKGSHPYRRAIEEFWGDFGVLMQALGAEVEGEPLGLTKERFVRFYDTPGRDLRRRDWIFRERSSLLGKKRRVTLKFRHPDRFLSQDRDLRSGAESKNRVKMKFEEDLKTTTRTSRYPVMSLYSLSSRQRVGKKVRLRELRDLFELYPGAAKCLGGIDSEAPFEVVNEFTARELVLEGGVLRLRGSVRAGCALILWLDPTRTQGGPLVAEFSFRYGDAKERYAREVSRHAYQVLETLRTGFEKWVDEESPTKTAFAYDLHRERNSRGARGSTRFASQAGLGEGG